MENVSIEELFENASRGEYSKIIRELNLIDVDSIRNVRNQTLLHVAAGYGRTNLVSYLIHRGVDVNVQDSIGQAPLHNACCHGHFTASSKLIKAGALVDIVDHKGWTPLHWALQRVDNVEKITPIYWKVVELLLASGADPFLRSISGKRCLDRIKNSEDIREIRLLYVMNKLDRCHEEETELRELIIDRYLDVEDYFELVKIGDVKLQVLEILSTPKLVNSRLASWNNMTPLHRAAGYNHLDVAHLLLQKGASVDATDNFGRIPLHNAAQYGHVEMIELLVNENSDINKQDHVGESPLHVAAFFNRTFTACLKLIELGANINLKCHEGKLPYDLANYGDVKEVLKPDKLGHRLIPLSSDDRSDGIYYDLQITGNHLQQDPANHRSKKDQLMLDSSSNKRLFNSIATLKKQTLNEKDPNYQEVKKRMHNTIMSHESGCQFSNYEILSIERILNEKVWSKYKLMCQRLEINYGIGSKNEKLLFHGSNFIDKIRLEGFNESYAQRNGMFGAGIYFAEHSSKSNQYVFGFGQGCQEHQDISCYMCERKLIYAQVALGRSLTSNVPMPDCAHAPPGYSSVTASPESTDNLRYPEYVVYSGDQAYPLFVIRYRIKL